MSTPTPTYCTQYARAKCLTLRSMVRWLGLSILDWLEQVTRQETDWQRPRVQFIYLHHLFDDEVAAFRNLVAILAQHHTFISYSEAVERVWTGRIDRAYIAFSVDDGFKNSLWIARILEEFDTTACFFVCGNLIGLEDYQQITRVCCELFHLPPIEFLTWEELEALLVARHEIGGHTLSHPNLARLSEAQLQDEIAGSFELLNRRLGKLMHFSWPYGLWRHFSPQAARAVFDACYRSCASAERGCHLTATPGRQLCIRRDHLVAAWPVAHSLYFLSRNARRGADGGTWPADWQSRIFGG